MQFLTGFTLFLTAMVSVTGAVPVSTDADAVAPDTDNYAADTDNFNTMPACPDNKTFKICTALNKHPYCVGTFFHNDIQDQCSDCYCE